MEPLTTRHTVSVPVEEGTLVYCGLFVDCGQTFVRSCRDLRDEGLIVGQKGNQTCQSCRACQ